MIKLNYYALFAAFIFIFPLGAAVIDDSHDEFAENSGGADKERDYIETFTLSDRKKTVQVGEIRLRLTKTNVKKGQYNIKVTIDGNTIEKKNQKTNEPLQFVAGSSRLSHELFVNWVGNNSAGGYLRVVMGGTNLGLDLFVSGKDKELAAAILDAEFSAEPEDEEPDIEPEEEIE